MSQLKKNLFKYDQMMTPKEKAAKCGVSVQTLRRWERQGKLQSSRTEGGHRRYNKIEVDDEKKLRHVAIYARVSSSKQQKDLQRQMDALKRKYPNAQVFSDVASGINWKRRGLRKLLSKVFAGEIEEIVIPHRDRLCRFAFPMLEWVVQQHDCKITVEDTSIQTTEEELADDLLSIVQIFCCRKNGQRSEIKHLGGF